MNSKFAKLVVICVLIMLGLLFIGAMMWAFGMEGESSKELDKVTIRMNWKFTGPHAAFFLEKELGIYKAEGIDLQIMEGSGSGTTALLVGNKTDTFGLADASSLIPLMAKELPIRCVGMVTPASALAIVVREDSGISSIKELVGKKVAAVAGGAPSSLWPALAVANNIDPDSVELVYVDAAAKIPVLLENKVAGLFGAADDQPHIMNAQGVPAKSFRFADNGVNLLNLGIFVHEDLIKENPDLIRRFLRATRAIIAAYYEDPEKAVAALVMKKPELTVEVALKQAVGFYSRVESPNCPDTDLLFNCPDDWQMTIDILKNYKGMEENISQERCYTNEFLD